MPQPWREALREVNGRGLEVTAPDSAAIMPRPRYDALQPLRHRPGARPPPCPVAPLLPNPPTPPEPGGWLRRRWRGTVAWPTIFWRDMLVVGTLVNLLASFGALMLVALGAPAAFAVALHFAPVPWNLLLFALLWRLPRRPAAAVLAGAAWVVLMTVV